MTAEHPTRAIISVSGENLTQVVYEGPHSLTTKYVFLPPSRPETPGVRLTGTTQPTTQNAYAEGEALDDSRSPRGFGFPVTTPYLSRITFPTNWRQRVMAIRREDTY